MMSNEIGRQLQGVHLRAIISDGIKIGALIACFTLLAGYCCTFFCAEAGSITGNATSRPALLVYCSILFAVVAWLAKVIEAGAEKKCGYLKEIFEKTSPSS